MKQNNKKDIFIKNLREKRLNMGYTQQEVADNLYISRCTYTAYELGLTDPNIYTLIDICSLLNTDISSLFEI